MYAPRQRGVESASTNRSSHHSYAFGSCTDPETGPGVNWTTRTHGSAPYTETGVTRSLERVWRFESVARRYGGHSGGVPPVPIPNTEDKPACVSVSTGVGDPLGNLIRRLHSYFITHQREPSTVVGSLFYLHSRSGSSAIIVHTTAVSIVFDGNLSN